MSTLNPCASVVIPTRRGWRQRWLTRAMESLSNACIAWAERAQAQAQWRALEGLSDETLRDIGMAERQPAKPTPGALDYGHGRWR